MAQNLRSLLQNLAKKQIKMRKKTNFLFPTSQINFKKKKQNSLISFLTSFKHRLFHKKPLLSTLSNRNELSFCTFFFAEKSEN